MNAPEELLNEFTEYLLNCDSLSEYKIIHAFPPYLKQSPLRKITLTCCVEKLKLSHVQSETKGDGVLSQADILITVHIPPKNGGAESETVCGKLSRELFFSSPFEIKSLECGKLSYRRETDSYTVPVSVSVEKFENDGEGGGTLPDTPLTDTVIEVGGEVAANAKLRRIKAFRDGKLISAEREEEAYGAVLGVINYQIELSDVYLTTERDGFFGLGNFTLIIQNNGRKTVYGGCEWIEVSAEYSGRERLIKKAVLLARSRVCEEAE